MQWWQPWELSSSQRVSQIQTRLRWVKLWTVFVNCYFFSCNILLLRRTLVGQNFARTLHGTWLRQLKTRSSTTCQSRPGCTRLCCPPRVQGLDASVNQQHFYRDGAHLPAHKLVLASQTSYFEGLFRQENPDQVANKGNNWSYLGQNDKQNKKRLGNKLSTSRLIF